VQLIAGVPLPFFESEETRTPDPDTDDNEPVIEIGVTDKKAEQEHLE
jgi:hypothetical protein